MSKNKVKRIDEEEALDSNQAVLEFEFGGRCKVTIDKGDKDNIAKIILDADGPLTFTPEEFVRLSSVVLTILQPSRLFS